MDAGECLTTALLSGVDNLKDGLVVFTPVLLDASLLTLGIYLAISRYLHLVHGLENLAELVGGDGVSLPALLSLEDVAVIAEALLVCLLNDVSGSKD